MRISTLAAAGVLTLVCASAALAQTSAPRTVRVGQSVDGELQARERDSGRNSIVDYFELRGTRGETVTITLKAEAFDPLLIIGKGDEDLADDDDGGVILDSKLVFKFPETTTYRISATSSDHTETGRYTLKIERGGDADDAAAATPARPRTPRDTPNPQLITYGQTVQGQLIPTSPEHRDNTPYSPYLFDGRKGEVVSIEMTAPEFDAYLVLQRPNGDSDLATDDDGLGDGTHAKLVFALPADGRYEIRANAVAEDATGAFTLKLGAPTTLEAIAREARAKAPVVNFGQVARGKLQAGDPKAEDGSLYDLYRFTGKAGQNIVIQLSSSDFDPYLVLQDAANKELVTNDNGRKDDTSAEILFTLPANGDYYIHANALDDGETGDYLLGLSVR